MVTDTESSSRLRDKTRTRTTVRQHTDIILKTHLEDMSVHGTRIKFLFDAVVVASRRHRRQFSVFESDDTLAINLCSPNLYMKCAYICKIAYSQLENQFE